MRLNQTNLGLKEQLFRYRVAELLGLNQTNLGLKAKWLYQSKREDFSRLNQTNLGLKERICRAISLLRDYD